MSGTHKYDELIIKYLDKTRSILIGYLNNILPKITKNWWEKTVIEKLSDDQKKIIKRKGITNLDGLDLAPLLRVFDGNWYEISQQNNLLTEDRNILKNMQTVRNHWSHIPGIGHSLETINRDFDTIQCFLEIINADQEIIKELKRIKLKIIKEMIKNERVNGDGESESLKPEDLKKDSRKKPTMMDKNKNDKPKRNQTNKGHTDPTKKHDNVPVRNSSELKKLQLEYWKHLENYFIKEKMPVKLSKPSQVNYNRIAIEVPDWYICLRINIKNNQLRCGLHTKNKNNYKKAFSALIKGKEIIKNELKDIKLKWNELGRIKIEMCDENRNIIDKDNWDNISEWFRKNTKILYEVFHKRII